MDKFNLLSSQRYYNMVSLKHKEEMPISKFWKSIGFKSLSGKNSQQEYVFDKYLVSQKRVLSVDAYHKTFKGDDRFKTQGVEGYQYDLIIIQLVNKNITLIGFPFIKMALDSFKSLNNAEVLKGSRFFKRSRN